jgi:hypothetical protein
MKPLRLAGLALLAVVMSCSDAVAPSHQVTDLETARLRWRDQNLHSYAFTLQRSCVCTNVNPLYVLVQSDTVAGVLDFETGEWIDRRLGKTVEGLFTFIQNATDLPAQRIRVTYDYAKGFPTEIDYDGAAIIDDDEIFYRISDVHTVPPAASASLGSR